MAALRQYIAGFLSTLGFHQGLFALLHALGVVPMAAWSMAPTAPLGVPQVFSLAFWGGVWAVALGALLRRARGARWWLGWIVLGALGPTVVALLVVFPLKQGGFGAATDPKLWVGGLLLNAAWGLGCAVLLKLMRQRA